MRPIIQKPRGGILYQLFIWILLCLPLIALSKKAPRYEVLTDTVKQQGFHRIILTPEITTRLNSRFSDLRLYDEKGTETPYLIRYEKKSSNATYFHSYEIVDLKQIRYYRRHWGNCTYLILRNPKKNKINNISLRIKNADVRKHLELTGSDDGENWYALKDDYVFESIINPDKTCEVKVLNFPYSDYEYYRIVISNRFSEPINILDAGYYDTYSEQGKYQTLSQPKIVQHIDSNSKTTRIKVTYPSTSYINRLQLNFDGPQYYYRTARIGKYVKGRKGKKHFVQLRHLEIGSSRSHVFDLGRLDEKEFWIIVDNHDNPPLHLTSLNAFQLNTYLDTYLEPGQQYKLKFGSPSMRHPNYDLAHFSNQIPHTPTVLSLGKIESSKKETLTPALDGVSTQVYIWIGIVLLTGILAWVSIGMIKDMGKKEESG